MAVTLQAVNADGTVLGSSITVYFTGVARMTKDKKSLTPVPGGNHILVPLGCEGPTLNLKFKIIGATEYAKLQPWKGGYKLNVTSSTVPEMPATGERVPSDAGSTGVNCEIWNVDECKSERAGGQVDEWDVSLTLTRYWNWVKS